MKDWIYAWKLARIEIVASMRSFIFLLIFLFFIHLFLIEMIQEYFINPLMIIDVLFLLLFTVAPAWLKPNAFQMKSNGSNYYVPSVVLYKQLPISESVIIKNRFIIYFTYALPLQIITLLSFYLLSSTMQQTLMPGEYLAFSIIWLSFSMYIGAIFVASDTGENGITKWKLIFYLTFYIVIFLAILFIVHHYFSNGILMITVQLAKNWPLLSIVISLLLAFGGYHYWHHMTSKALRKTDFF